MASTLEILERLVAFDTVSAKSNLALADYAGDFLRERGFRVERLDDPTQDKAGLYAEIGPAGAGVALSAHSDVVPVEGQDWSRDPFRLTREGDLLYGRGTTDMKGFLACMLAAAARAGAMPLREPLKLVISYDEEVGCTGIARMRDRLALALGAPRACIVGEPTQMQVASGHKGKIALTAVCRGEAGHSAHAPRYVNALHVAMDFVAELRALQDLLIREGARDDGYGVAHSTIHVGRLAGGGALNVVPDCARIAFEARHLAGDAPDALRGRIDAAADRVAKAHGPAARIEIDETFRYPGLDAGEGCAAVALARRISGAGAPVKVSFGTEAGIFAALGVPVAVCGPGSMDRHGHKADECVEADQLAACDAMLERLLGEMS